MALVENGRQAVAAALREEYDLVLMDILRQQDWGLLRAEAHKLKGSAGVLGWPQVGKLAGEIETLLRISAPGAEPEKALEELLQRLLECTAVAAG